MPEVSLTRDEIEDLVINNATKHPKYKEMLLADPKGMVEKQLNNKLPEDLDIKVVEEGPNTVYVRLPYNPQSGEELSDADLEAVAGGKGDATYSCNEAKGGFNTHNEFASGVTVEK